MAEALRWSQAVIELTDGDPTKGDILFGSPLAAALASRGTARWAMGREGWRDDYHRALAMAGGPTQCRVPASTPTPTVSR